MTFYVVATDRTGGEMRPGGIVLEKHIFVCDNYAQADRIIKALKERNLNDGKPRFSAIQTTRTMPVLNPRIYNPVLHVAASWLQGRC